MCVCVYVCARACMCVCVRLQSVAAMSVANNSTRSSAVPYQTQSRLAAVLCHALCAQPTVVSPDPGAPVVHGQVFTVLLVSHFSCGLGVLLSMDRFSQSYWWVISLVVWGPCCPWTGFHSPTVESFLSWSVLLLSVAKFSQSYWWVIFLAVSANSGTSVVHGQVLKVLLVSHYSCGLA